MADIKDIVYERISRQWEAREEYYELLAGIDKIVDMKWEMPSGLANQEWARPSVDPSGHDAIKAANNIFDTQGMKWDVQPLSPDDHMRAEKFETWLDWQFMLLNKRNHVLRESLDHALKYDIVCGQIDYLPHWAVDKKKYKGSPFVVKLHHPCNVTYEFNDFGLHWVAVVENVYASDVVNHWKRYASNKNDESKKLKAGLAKIEKWLEDDSEQRVMFIDYTDEDSRYMYCYPVSSETIDDEFKSEEMVVLMDSKNEMPFITWVISEGRGDPMLKPLHDAKLWSNLCLMSTAIDSEVYKTLFMPIAKEITLDGEPKDEDYTGAYTKWTGRPGENYDPTSPPPIDPRKRELLDRYKAQVTATTGLKNIMNADIVGNLQFATYNAMLQMTLSMLESPRKVVEHFWSEMACKMLEWLDFKGDSMEAFYTKDSKNFKRGSMITLNPAEDYDINKVYIQAELQANTPSDKVQRINFAAQVAQTFPLSMPHSELLEDLGLGNAEALKQHRMMEIAEDSAITNWQKLQAAKVDLQIQEQQITMQMQVQQEVQAQQQQQAMEQQAQQEQMMQQQGAFPQGMGYAPGMGGASPYEAAPDMTRTMMEGGDITGNAPAGMA